LFSFVNVCEALEIDPAFLRQGLLAWKEKQAVPSPPSEATTSARAQAGRRRGSLRAA
jgi:hypothetical protein